MEEFAVIEIIRTVLFWLSPILFLLGILLVLYGNYRTLEDQLGEDIGGIRKKIILMLENNIDTFHEWLIKRKTILGILCIIAAVSMFLLLKK